jgi:hypothetical protein
MPYKDRKKKNEHQRIYYRTIVKNNPDQIGRYKIRARNRMRDLNGISNENIDPDDIENAFKVEPPLFEMDGGFGYLGVVRRNRVLDVIQCHICGKWYANLTPHISRIHEMSVRAYKMRYQLPIKFPLISRRLSMTISKNSSKPEALERLKRDLPKLLAASHGKRGRRNSRRMLRNYSRQNLSFQNKRGICERQIEDRYVGISEVLGCEPSWPWLNKNEPSLHGIIQRRYGTFNRFKKLRGFVITPRSRLWSERALISKIRMVAKHLHRIPRSGDFRVGSPNYQTFLYRFGSWNRALTLAGF